MLILQALILFSRTDKACGSKLIDGLLGSFSGSQYSAGVAVLRIKS
jgi:hypothetical protein